MKVDPSGIVTIGECDLRLPGCRALTPAPVMAILVSLGREVAATVCRSCLDEMVRLGEWEIPGAHLKRRFDIAVYDKDERLRLVVDVKNYSYKHEGDSEQWGTRIRRNLVRHAAVPIYVYFLLAISPAPFYLWLPEDASETPPHYCFDVQAELPRLYKSKTVSDYQQQIDAVYSWLTALSNEPLEDAEQPDWLGDSRLYEAIQGGTIVKRADVSVGPAETREPQVA